jgi:uncharacterized protein VirK/YbjX
MKGADINGGQFPHHSATKQMDGVYPMVLLVACSIIFKNKTPSKYTEKAFVKQLSICIILFSTYV